MNTKTAPGGKEAAGLHVGNGPVTQREISRILGKEMELASLPVARSIQKRGCYWIGTEGVPTKEGFFIDNTDGAFKNLPKGFVEILEEELHHKYKDCWSAHVYVSPEAAYQASRGEGPLHLGVRDDTDASTKRCRLVVLGGGDEVSIGRVVSMPKAGLKEAAQRAVRKE